MVYENVIPYLMATIGPDLSTRRSKLAYARLFNLDMLHTKKEAAWLSNLSIERLIEQVFGVTPRRLNALYREQTFRISGGLPYLQAKRSELANEIIRTENRRATGTFTPGERQALSQKITSLRRRQVELDVLIGNMERDRREYLVAREKTEPAAKPVAPKNLDRDFTPCESSLAFSKGMAMLLDVYKLTLKGFFDSNRAINVYETTRCFEGRTNWTLPRMDYIAKALGTSAVRILAAGRGRMREEIEKQKRHEALEQLKAEKARVEAKLERLQAEEEKLNELGN